MTVPPVDRDGESRRANTALQRCRNAIKKANLPNMWQRWVAESVVAGYPEPTPTKAPVEAK